MSNNCSNFKSAEITYILQGVIGSIGAVVCIVALIFVLVSRFYKDIVQRLIVYKLIAMLVYSLSQPLLLIFIYCNEESTYYKIIEKIVPGLIPAAYFINLFLTFWLSIVLFFWLIFLKELKTLQKIEPLMIISSLFGVAFLIIYAIFVEFNDCTFNTNSSSIVTVRNIFKGLGAFYGLLHFMIVMMLIIIVITVCKRSRSHLVNEEENNSLLTNDTCKMLLKQLLPIIVYPIITVIFSFIYIFVFVTNIPFPSSFKFALSFLLSAPGPVTGLVVIIYLCILKCKCRKKSGREEEKEDLSENGGRAPTMYYSISTIGPPVND